MAETADTARKRRGRPGGSRLFRRLTISYIVLVVLVLCVLLPLYNKTLAVVKERTVRDNYAVLYNAYSVLMNRLEVFNRVFLHAYRDPMISQLTLLAGPLDTVDYYKLRTAHSFIQSLIDTDDLVREYVFYLPGSGLILTKARAFDSVRSMYGEFIAYEGLEFDEWLQRLQATRTRSLWPEHVVWRYEGDERRECLTYVMAFPLGGSASPKGIAAVLLDKKRLLQLLLTPESAAKGWLYLRDLSGAMLLRHNYRGEALRLRGGATEIRVGSVRTTVVSIPEFGLGTELVAGYPMSIFTQGIAAVRKLILIYVSIAFLLGGAIAVLLAYRHSKPWNALAKYAEAIAANPPEIGTATRENARPDEYVRIARAIEQQRELLSAGTFERALRSGIHTRDEALTAARYLAFLPSAYYLALVRITPRAPATDNDNGSELVRMATLTLLRESLDRHVTVQPVDVDDYAVLIDAETAADPDRSAVGAHLLRAARAVEERFTAAAACGVSARHQGIEALSEAFEEAQYVIRTAGPTDDGESIWYIPKARREGALDFPLREEQKLHQLTLSGERGAAVDLVRSLIDRNTGPGVGEGRTRQFYYALRGTICRAALEIEPERAVDLPDYDGAAGIGESMQELVGVIEALCRLSEARKRSHNTRLKQDVLQYIDAHYGESSLYAESVARAFGISTKYLSNFIKEQTGSTFGDHVEGKRMESATRLLVETDLPLAEIARKSGFASTNTFYKTFRRVHGMSPSVWREIRLSGGKHETPR